MGGCNDKGRRVVMGDVTSTPLGDVTSGDAMSLHRLEKVEFLFDKVRNREEELIEGLHFPLVGKAHNFLA